jgi:hypothetical protein
MLLANLLPFLGGFRGAHFRALFITLLLRHDLAAIDRLLLIRRKRDAGGQGQGGGQGRDNCRSFHHRGLLVKSG